MTSEKRSPSEEFVLPDKEEPSSTIASYLTSETTISAARFEWKYFDSKRIDSLLLQSSSFTKAIHLVDGLIQNENLNVYYSHVAIPELRSVNIFDKQQSLQYSSRIQSFLCQLVQDLRFIVVDLPDAYSHFVGNYAINSSGKDDVIQYDTTTINGIIRLEQSKRTTAATIAKQVFFLFSKTLHELGHASIYRSGRLMMSTYLNLHSTYIHVNKKNEFFNTPATHALTGEAGSAIERLLFGSVIGTIEKKDGDSYIIKEILLQEQKPNGIIDSSWLTTFINLDLSNLNAIPTIVYSPLTNKKLKATKSSPKCDEDQTSNDDDEDDDQDEDDDDEPLLTTTN